MRKNKNQEEVVYQFIEKYIDFLSTEEGDNSMHSMKQNIYNLSEAVKRVEGLFVSINEARNYITKLAEMVGDAYINLKVNLAIGSVLTINGSTNKMRLTPMIYSDESGDIKVYRQTDQSSMTEFILSNIKKANMNRDGKVIISLVD